MLGNRLKRPRTRDTEPGAVLLRFDRTQYRAVADLLVDGLDQRSHLAAAEKGVLVDSADAQVNAVDGLRLRRSRRRAGRNGSRCP